MARQDESPHCSCRPPDGSLNVMFSGSQEAGVDRAKIPPGALLPLNWMSHAMECTLFYVLALGLHIGHHGVEASAGVLRGSLVFSKATFICYP